MKNYEAPMATPVCEMKAEQVFAAQSWNNGKGNTDHNGTGNGGTNYNDGAGNSNQFREEQNTHGKNA